jgi:15-cis-phytoene synthase
MDIQRFSPEITLALGYASRMLRPAFTTLFALDTQLGAALSSARDPALARIRLAWWRDQLLALDENARPTDPILAQCVTLISRHDVTSQMLAELTTGWEYALATLPLSDGDLLGYAKERGQGLFAIAGACAGVECFAGEGWALMDFARHCSDPDSRTRAQALARGLLQQHPARVVPKSLRPFGILTRFAEQDLDCVAPASPLARVGQALKYRFAI